MGTHLAVAGIDRRITRANHVELLARFTGLGGCQGREHGSAVGNPVTNGQKDVVDGKLGARQFVVPAALQGFGHAPRTVDDEVEVGALQLDGQDLIPADSGSVRFRGSVGGVQGLDIDPPVRIWILPEAVARRMIVASTGPQPPDHTGEQQRL